MTSPNFKPGDRVRVKHVFNEYDATLLELNHLGRWRAHIHIPGADLPVSSSFLPEELIPITATNDLKN